MRVFTVALIISFLSTSLTAQNKIKRVFKLPANISSADYQSGIVVVKLKESHKQLFESDQTSSRVSNSGIFSATPLISKKLTSNSQARMAPRKSISGIDLSLYYTVRFNPKENIEDFINKLYATGHFEIVEPEYVDRLYFTPNDPNIPSQYYLNLIKAFDAWDITKGSDDVVIAIIDSGGDLDHPDLASKLWFNESDPINGSGWDFVGADTLNANNPDFIGDNDPSVFKGGTISHGTNVAGCAAAATNNGMGIAGVGFNTKIMFTKHSGDNQKPTSGAVYRGYSGVLYAAEVLYASNKKAIINLSWGGRFRSQVAQDIITYVTLDRNALVIGAAGNEDSSEPHYPSGYDYVLSVAATNSQDVKADFSNYGKTVDISAPGASIHTTSFNDVYSSPSGTSFSCPIVSGAAALVWAHNPTFSPVQVAEQLRVSADESFYSKNTGFQRMLGKGRLDILRALTLELPSLRASKPKLVNNQGLALEPGQSGKLTLSFQNLLKSSSSGTQVTITSLSTRVTITKGTITLGIVPEGTTISNQLNPFELSISASTPLNTVVDLLLTYQDGAYSDYQFISFIINPSFIDVDENQIATTLTATGRIGFDNPSDGTNGTGFVFNNTNTLFEMGLIMGSSTSSITNNVRGINSGFDQDFFIADKIKKIIPGEKSYSEVFGSFRDANAEANAKLKINYRSLVWRDSPHDKFVIIEYVIKNNSAIPLENFYFGVFADWDISFHGANDKADFYSDDRIRMGYVYPAQSNELPLAGIQLLNQINQVKHYAIDNDHRISGIPFGLYDGYTDDEKFSSVSTNRDQAGTSTAEGNDVSHVVSVGPLNIPSGGEIKLAFALHSGFNFSDLVNSAKHADTLYNFTLQATKPQVEEIQVCYGESGELTATGADAFKWYANFTGGDPISTEPSIIVPNLKEDTILYVSNAVNTFESVRTPAIIRVKANPAITASGFTTICEGQSIILSVAEADEYLWSNGATDREIEINEPGDFSVTVTDFDLDCVSLSDVVTITVNPVPVAEFSFDPSSVSHTPIQFTDGSTDAISWFWQFGDTESSSLQNPTHQYKKGGDFSVNLTVTAANGCQDTNTKSISVITSTEKELQAALSVFPNPTKGDFLVEVTGLSSPHFTIQLMNGQGQPLYAEHAQAINGKLTHTIPSSTWPLGLYFIKIFNEGNAVTRKIVKID
jgi:serine protease